MVYTKLKHKVDLFEYIKGDRDSIMGLPIKEIVNYINNYKK